MSCGRVRGRSPDTARRARDAGLADVGELREVAASADMIVLVCPPHVAIMDAAQRVAWVRTAGLLHIDANSVVPQTVRGIAELFPTGVGVDAVITGSPRLELGATVLWLSGPRSAEAVALFARSLAATRIVGAELSQASAVEACAGLRSKVIPAVWATLINAAKANGPAVEQSFREHLADIGYDMSEQEAKIT